MMGFWQPVTNIRDYIFHNPPWVTFFLCLLALAVSFIGLGSYISTISTNTLPNPDTTLDWNYLLSSLSEFQLCVKANANSSELVSPVPSSLTDRDTSIQPTQTPPVTTLHLRVPLAVTANSNSGSLKDLGLYTTLRAKELHIGGNEIVDVTLKFLSGNDTCLTISAPTHLLPMSLLPPECPVSEKNISPIHMEASKESTASQSCYSLHFKNDPTLTVLLTQEELRVAVRHLLEVGMCLIGVCLMICLTAGLTHSLIRRHHWSELDLQNEALID
ncbi:transmembrane protein 248 [Larimichthys crocea]|uniref:transmembrane protein 248 n=1 Tax=Larimichthys crocea TaxID=215358 RepID=UPI000901D783|nr:transmembrane protein 248-like [Larimichthys crocea]